MKENQRKCLKCGSSPAVDPDTKLFRFPKPGSTNVLRCETWARYCFSSRPWDSTEFQMKLHREHRMLCHRHFRDEAFVDLPSKKLKRFACPDTEEIHEVQFLQPRVDPEAGPSQPFGDVTNATSITRPSSLCSNINVVLNNEDTAFRKNQKYFQKVCSLRKQLKYAKNKQYLHKLTTSDAVAQLAKKLSPSFCLLLQSQLRNFKRSPKARKWSAEDKITALRLFKRSPTCYRLLRRMFCLPAQTTLKALLKRCNLNIGINDNIFKIVGKFASTQEHFNNEYVMMFDEMAVKKHLNYKHEEDCIEGFQDHGVQGRTSQPVSHALVFMIAGIRKKIKQPMAYYLSGSSVTADRLAVLIKEVLEQCHKHGINIAATVCDMDGVNRRALKILGANAGSPHFNICDRKIFALFDPPHLIKCFRNLFMKYDIQCSTNISSPDGKHGTGVAKWSHIVQFYELDNSNTNFVFAPCLKKEHLNPNTKQKMRVKLAVQVLSHTVAAGMFAKISQGELTADASVTADLISRMDKLFDALNSDTVDLRRGKPFATNWKKSSPHLLFVKEMKLFLKNVKFIGCKSSPPSQEGWLWTLNGVEMVWESLCHKHKSIKSLSTRRLQQDPLENLFGCIRGNCGSNCNPTSGQFVAGLKTAILSNLTHIGSGNCEIDQNEVIINNYKQLLLTSCQSTAHTEEMSTSSSVWDIKQINISDKLLQDSGESQACAYVCGFILKKFRNRCEKCLALLTTKDRIGMHVFTQFKEHNDFTESLNYASEKFVFCVEFCATSINSFLSNNAHKKGIKQEVTNSLKISANFDFLNGCTEHKDFNINFILHSVFAIVIQRFCTKKNRYFSEETAKVALKKKIDLLRNK